ADAAAAPADAAAAPADAAALSPSSLAADIRMCLMVHACGYTTARYRTVADLFCLSTVLQHRSNNVEMDSIEQRARYARMRACAATQTTCDAFVRCADFDTPCSGSATASCVGHVAVRCSTPGGNHLPRVIDCAAVGQTCQAGVCAVPASAPACAPDQTSSSARCDGNTRVWCRPRVGGGNGELREPCPGGTVCQAGSDNAVCAPPNPSCAAEGARCEGDTAVLCARGTAPDGSRPLLELRTDCAAIGARCMPDARGIARCVPTATECTPVSANGPTTATCEGNVVSVCLNGTRARIDCTAVGRARCGTVMPIAGLGSPYPGCLD
ncbi:MAG: hypothetical protein Q8S73_00020, partial [Deltaproteobacteria bacterium]|nr:hypothetical protein [Deltaproteobacteria bacterium]